MDYGHEQTDKELKELENRISKEYQRAAVDVKKKSKEYMEKFKAKDKIKREQLKNGEITKSDYNQWKTGQIMIGKRWEEMRDTLYQDLSNAKEIAKSMTTEFSYDVYALNHNYGTFEVESGSLMNTSYTLYDRDTVYTMIKDEPTLLPNFKEGQKDIEKDKRWSLTKMNSAVLQGILQGESMDGIAKRLSDVVGMDERVAISNARTMTTAAENLGRQHSYERAQKMGINLEKQWMATLDSRTRDSHRMLDGETVKINETFSNKLECPGDPSGDPSEVYNCRCTMVGVIAKIQHEELRDENGNILTKDSALGDMSYEEWKHGHEKQKTSVANVTHVIAQGKDISATWKRRPNDFAFEIEDVINAQGFDGLPRVVSAEEFDEYVKESNIIMQRGYTAPDQETLKAYQNELYNGKWYVDCSSGGHMYGRGMYADGRFGTSVNESMTSVMQGYGGVNPNGKVETFTLTSDAKILDYKDVDRLRQEYGRDAISKIVGLEKESKEERLFAYSQMGMTNTEETIKAMNWASENSNKIQDIYTKYISPYSKEIGEIRNKAFSMDEGVLASLKGYDAINCESIVKGDSDGYFVILNRTKCIFQGE